MCWRYINEENIQDLNASDCKWWKVIICLQKIFSALFYFIFAIDKASTPVTRRTTQTDLSILINKLLNRNLAINGSDFVCLYGFINIWHTTNSLASNIEEPKHFILIVGSSLFTTIIMFFDSTWYDLANLRIGLRSNKQQFPLWTVCKLTNDEM